MSDMLRNLSRGLWDQYPIGMRLDSAFLNRRCHQIRSAIFNAVMLFWSLFSNIAQIWPVLITPFLAVEVNDVVQQHIPSGSRATKNTYLALIYPLGYLLGIVAVLVALTLLILAAIILPTIAIAVLGPWAIFVLVIFCLWFVFYRYPVFQVIYPRLRRRILLNNAQVYSDLPEEPPTIRVLRLKPGGSKEKIECDLIEGPLSQTEFEALSYVWGVTLVPYTIVVNGKPFLITYNLYSALKELRHTDRERLLWVDAVCINQYDNLEKSTQVQMMRDIYARSLKVVVWLGKSTRATRSTFEFMQQFGDANTDQMAALWKDHTTLPAWKRMRAEYIDIFEHDWWSRAWIIQEVVVGRNVWMQRGRYQVEWEAVCKLFTYGSFGNDEFGSFEPPLFAKNVQRLRDETGNAEDSRATLGDLVIQFRLQSATFGSDKIYALLGLLKPDDPSLITPDYNKSPNEVFLQFTETCLFSMKRLDILGLAPGTELQGVSWCRDWWLNHDGSFKAYQLSALEPPRPFSASGCHQPAFEIDLEHRVLSIRGYTADTVLRTGSFHESMGTQVDWDLVFRGWEHVAGGDLGDDEMSALRRSFNRTVTADCWQTEPLDWRKRITPRQKRPRDGEDANYTIAVEDACVNRRFFLTRKNRFGLGPWNMKTGDVISILSGGKTPFILRRCTQKTPMKGSSVVYHKLIGEAFVDGLMYQDGSLQDDAMSQFHLM